MVFMEGDIDFTRLDWKQFDELCFDLLIKYQFHSIMWRKGGVLQFWKVPKLSKNFRGILKIKTAIRSHLQRLII